METIEHPTSVDHVPQTVKEQRVSLFEQINLNVFWLTNNFHWQALLAIVIPSMVAKFLDPAQKDFNLAFVVSWGTIVAVIVNPLVGAISDYATFRMGRRRPFMIFGTILNVIVLVAFAYAPVFTSSPGVLLSLFALLFILLQFSYNFANSPWSAIIADKVPDKQRRLKAGFNGLFTFLGIIAGSVVAYTVFTVKETPLPPTRGRKFELILILKKFFFKPSRYPDLSWVLLARLLVMMGIWGIFYFLQYYFDDVLGGPGVKTI